MGCVGSASTFSRSRRTCTVTVDWSPKDQPQTSWSSWSREKATPGLASRKHSRSNSRLVSDSAVPASVTVCALGSRTRSPSASGPSAGFALPPARRSTDADAQHELARTERLGHVVVRAVLEPDDAVHLAAEGGEHDDRDVALGAEAARDLQAVDAGKHQVEHHEVGRGLVHGGERLLAVGCLADVVPGGAEVRHDDLADRVVVVDDEHGGHDRLPLSTDSAVHAFAKRVPGASSATAAASSSVSTSRSSRVRVTPRPGGGERGLGVGAGVLRRHRYAGEGGRGSGRPEPQHPPAAVEGGAEHCVRVRQQVAHPRQLVAGDVRGVHADLHDRGSGVRGDVVMRMRESLGEPVAALGMHGPARQPFADLATPEGAGQVTGQGEVAPSRPERRLAGIDRVQQGRRREVGGRVGADGGGEAGLGLAGHGSLGHDESDRPVHVSTLAKSRAARREPRTEPDTLERVPSARGW